MLLASPRNNSIAEHFYSGNTLPLLIKLENQFRFFLFSRKCYCLITIKIFSFAILFG